MAAPAKKRTVKRQVESGQKSLAGLEHPTPPTLWPEWSDADVNAEKWGNPLHAPGKDKKSGRTDTPKSKSDKSTATTATAKVETEQFDDPYDVPLPRSLKPTQLAWVKPTILVDESVRLVVFSPNSPLLPDLVTKNRELFHSSLIRTIVSAVNMLCYIGQTRPFAVEWQTALFQSPNTEKQAWKPWHHIYSIGKAGKGQAHNPIGNSLGKYVVRLYWLGCWRKFIVDDKYPVDDSGKLLLPLSNIPNDKEFELWPLLLSKALMKIASLTWTENKEIVDFDVVTCLTGWAVQKIFTKGMEYQDVWQVICGYSDHYTWDPRLILGPPQEEPVDLGASMKGTSVTSSRKTSGKDTKSSKGGTVSNFPPRSFHLTASCVDLRSMEVDSIEDITPCYSHDILIEETRNIPLIKQIPEYDRNIAQWKEFRWVDWAVAHGLWDRVYDWEIYKCMRMVSAMRKIDEYVFYKQETSEQEKFIKHSVEIVDEFVEKKKQEKLVSVKGAAKEKKKEGSKKASSIVFDDPSIWSDFAKVAPYITCVSIYLKPSSFKTNYVVSDIPFNTSDSKQKKPIKKDDKKKGGDSDETSLQYIHWENVLMKSRNEAIYLFTDSIDLKLTMFSLTHLGNELPKSVINFPKRKSDIKCNKLVCTRNKCVDGCICQKAPSEQKIAEELYTDTRKYGHVIVEDYNWKSRSIGETQICLKTCGNKSVLMDFERGRHVKRIWVESESPYTLLIFCDTEMKVGKVDEILDEMVEESENITQRCYDICTSFGRLIKFFGFPEYNVAIKLFYKSYLPVVNLSKMQMSLIHDSFQQELIKILAEYFPPEKHYELSRAFRILFLNPHFRIPYTVHKKPKVELHTVECECPCEDIDTIKLRECAATKIQACFKMLYVKKLKSLHDPTSKKFQPILDVLKLVYQNIFSTKVRNINIDLLRSFALNPNMQNIIQYYPYYKDINSVIVLKQFFGDVFDVPEYSWVPLVRRTFFCNSSDGVFIRAYVFCALADYVLRIINNDTGIETERHTNTALVSEYKKNEKGYTVLAYGWTYENPIAHLNWKLYLVVEKILTTSPVVCENVNNLTAILKGNYVPNKDNLICKYILKVQESCLGTFHFEVSYPAAKLKIQCLNKSDDILFETTGTGAVLVPVVSLFKKQDEGPSQEDLKLSMKSSLGFTHSRSNSKRSSKSRFGSTTKKGTSRNSLERKSIGSSSSKMRKSIDDGVLEFSLRVFVIEDSWPLTAKEWELVQILRQKLFIEHELNFSATDSHPDVTKTTIVESELIKGSFFSEHTYYKQLHNLVFRKPKFSTSQRKSKDNYIFANPDKPYWVLTTIRDAQPNFTIEIDERRCEEIKNIKRNLFENDSNRFLQGQILRNAFLENNWIRWSTSSVEGSGEGTIEIRDTAGQIQIGQFVDIRSASEAISSDNFVDASFLLVKDKLQSDNSLSIDKSTLCPECNKPIPSAEISFLRPPANLSKILPPFDVNKCEEQEDKFRWLILPEQEEHIFNSILENVVKFDVEQNKFVNEMTEHLEKMKSRNEYLWKWYGGIRKASNQMMIDSENRRQELVKKIKEEKGKKK